MTGQPSPHEPVLYQEIIDYLRPISAGKYVDATVGAGGHAHGILQSSSPDGRLLGLDLDDYALELAGQRLLQFKSRVVLRKASYATLKEQLQLVGWDSVQGILIDLGVSSMQVDIPERGFSFLTSGPLDMRFDAASGKTAADLVNLLPVEDLTNILREYGEEPQARRIAHAIVANRPMYTTLELSEVIQKAVGLHRGRIHPATRTFQALRIATNEELQSLESVLPQAVAALAPQGRLAVISFHSLEDRITKHFLQRESRDCICPPKQPVCTCQHRAKIKLVSRRAISPDENEVRLNPRARSAKLRVAEKL